MVDEFILKLVLSFIVGGVWVSFATVAAEKWGSKAGGLIGSLPSTIVVSLFFIGWTNTPEFAAKAAIVVPAAMGACVLFLLAYIMLVKRGVVVATAGATLSWFVVAVPTAQYLKELWLSFLMLFLIVALSFYALRKMSIKSKGSIKVSYGWKKLVFRACFAGAVIVLAVVLAKLGGPAWGGVFAVYPAVFTSTMVILTLEHGAQFTSAVGKTYMLASPVMVCVYALVLIFSYPAHGLLIGTALSYLAALVTAVIVFQFVKRLK